MINDGTITPIEDEAFLLEYSDVYPTDVDDLWAAVTRPERLARWMTNYTGDLRLGGRWTALADDGSEWGVGEVIACDPPRSYTTIWQAPPDPPSEVTVTLEPVEGGTRLDLRHSGVKSIFYGAGWHVYFEQLLRHITEDGADVADEGKWDARFAEISDHYAEKFEAIRFPKGD